MLIKGIAIDELIISQALASMDPNLGFRASDLEDALAALGVEKGEVAMRAADRALQRARRAGKLIWKDRRWHLQEDGQ